MSYQPSDEQIGALCQAEAVLFKGDPDIGATGRFVKHPAFQSIIRAAQAAALRDYANDCTNSYITDALNARADRIENSHA